MAIIKVNYGINRKRIGKRGTEHTCGKLEIEGDWEQADTHKRIKAIITERHPGWLITGYAYDKGVAAFTEGEIVLVIMHPQSTNILGKVIHSNGEETTVEISSECGGQSEVTLPNDRFRRM